MLFIENNNNIGGLVQDSQTTWPDKAKLGAVKSRTESPCDTISKKLNQEYGGLGSIPLPSMDDNWAILDHSFSLRLVNLTDCYSGGKIGRGTAIQELP